jgi:hypothetical protein
MDRRGRKECINRGGPYKERAGSVLHTRASTMYDTDILPNPIDTTEWQ